MRLVRMRFISGGSSMPSITTSSWLSASPPPPPIIPGIIMSADRAGQLLDRRRVDRPARLGAHLEHALAPGGGLEHEVAVPGQRALRAEEQLVVHRRAVQRLEARAERLAAHADGVDLVDEDDALAAPLAREPLGLEGEVADEHRVHPDEGLREAGARDRHERAVERGGDALGEHRLAGAGGAEEEHAALALAARLLELLARLPQRDDARDLLLRLRLAADVGELDAPVRVARLVALDLAGAEQQQRAEQDQEVREEEDEDDRQVAEEAPARRRRTGRRSTRGRRRSSCRRRRTSCRSSRSRPARPPSRTGARRCGTSCASTRPGAARRRPRP